MLNTAAKTQAHQHLQQDSHKGVVGVQYIKFYTSVNTWGDPNANPSRQDARRQICDYPDRIYFCWRMHGLEQACTHYMAAAALLWLKFDNFLLFRHALKCLGSPGFHEIWGFHEKWTIGLGTQSWKDLDEGLLGNSTLNSICKAVFLEYYE